MSIFRLILATCLTATVAGCVSSSGGGDPPRPAATTVVVPSGSSVVCSDGTAPPCR